MARAKRTLIGYLSGVVDGSPETLSVYKEGRSYRLASLTKDHLCHPSVSEVGRLRGEALLVFHLKDGQFSRI